MKYLIYILLVLFAFTVKAADDNYVEKFKMAEGFRENVVAVDARDLGVLAKAADSWFWNKESKNYLRVQQDNLRYEIDINDLKDDGYLPVTWANRFSSTLETTALNHPYVISVVRTFDSDGTALTPYTEQNRKYRFDRAIIAFHTETVESLVQYYTPEIGKWICFQI